MQITSDRNMAELSTDEKYMLRCIQIAKNGLGTTAPNPMVGAVIVHNGVIIAEGHTSPYGGAHAEVNAINAVAEKPTLSDATLYVTLEPCSHYGKTPPCADLIIKYKIPRVVIGLKDPHGKVAGKGIQKLMAAGCEVSVGILEKACREQHRRFLTFHQKKRPYIILKWAETSDGFIAPEKSLRTTNAAPYWITGILARQLVHKWRSEEQAILVGTTTVLEDNPKLDVRLWTGTAPIRVVLDRELKTPTPYHVLDRKQKTIVFTESKDAAKYINGVDYELITPKNSAQNICDRLFTHHIQSLIVEGGSKTLQSFIDANLWDEARIFKSDIIFKKGTPAPRIKGRIIAQQQLRNDQLNLIRND